MGVDCKIYLPANVFVDNVAKVLGALCGCPVEKVPLYNKKAEPWSARVGGVEVRSTHCVSLAEIFVTRACVDGQKHSVFYHFETCNNEGMRMLHPRSTAFWIAVGCKLVSFFGGYIDMMDCDDTDADLSFPHKTWRENSPQDGDEWQAFQHRVVDLKPITEAEWRLCDQFAAYKIEESKS